MPCQSMPYRMCGRHREILVGLFKKAESKEEEERNGVRGKKEQKKMRLVMQLSRGGRMCQAKSMLEEIMPGR
jgi:hypothetical protein